jgi:hypothetical protein
LFAAIIAVVALAVSVGVVSFVAHAGITGIQGPAGLNGTNGLNGPRGANGYNGSVGPQGPQGIQGPPANDTMWTNLSFVFQFQGNPVNLSVTFESCIYEQHGVYYCTVTAQNAGSVNATITGIYYPPTNATYLAETDPTLGSIIIPFDNTATWNLWFQSVDSSQLQYTDFVGVELLYTYS